MFLEIVKEVCWVVDILVISMVILKYMEIDEKLVVGILIINISVGKEIVEVVCYFCKKYFEFFIIVIGGLMEESIVEII